MPLQKTFDQLAEEAKSRITEISEEKEPLSGNGNGNGMVLFLDQPDSIGTQPVQESARTLAELFAGRIGGIHGGGSNGSQNIREDFADAMCAKHKHEEESSQP